MLLQFRFIFYNQTLLVALHVQPHASEHLYMNIHAMNVSRFHIFMCTVCFYECTYLYMQSLLGKSCFVLSDVHTSAGSVILC